MGSSLAGALVGAAVVFTLLGLSMRALRRYAGALGGGRGRLPLKVVQRVAVGPRQGIAVVRIGARLVAVSVGDGGVRPVLELDEADRALLEQPAPAPLPALAAAVPAARFRAALLSALGSTPAAS